MGLDRGFLPLNYCFADSVDDNRGVKVNALPERVGVGFT